LDIENKLQQTQKAVSNAHQKEEGAFEPGAHTKELLFGTRKRKRIWGGVEFPGLFSNENIAGDSNWFWFAILLESIGLIALCYALWEETTLSVPFVIIIGLVVIFFDIVFAWIHHFVLTPKKCEIENEKLRIFPDMRKAEEHGKSYYDYIRLNHLQIPSWRVVISKIAGGLIVILGILKAIVFTMHLPQGWSEQVRTIILIPCLLSYCIVAYIHLTKTGFYIAYRRYISSYKKDRSKFDAMGNPDQFKRLPDSVEISLEKFVTELDNTNSNVWKSLIPKDEKIRENQIQKGFETDLSKYEDEVGQHKIILIDETPKIYELRIMGRLPDSELEALVKAQPEGLARSAIAIYGHYLQMKNLKASVTKDGEV